jgi:hypothetical protein
MTTIIIRPKSRDEKNLLAKLLKKMNIEASIIEDPTPNFETQNAISDVEHKKGTRVKNSDELFNMLGI